MPSFDRQTCILNLEAPATGFSSGSRQACIAFSIFSLFAPVKVWMTVPARRATVMMVMMGHKADISGIMVPGHPCWMCDAAVDHICKQQISPLRRNRKVGVLGTWNRAVKMCFVLSFALPKNLMNRADW